MKKALQRVVGAGVVLASLSVLAMMLIGAGDIAATLLKLPIPGALELIQLLMVLVVFLALPAVELERKHIGIDVITARLPPRVRAACAIIGSTLGLLFYGAMAWQAWKLFWDSWTIRQYATGLVAFPVYPTKALFALGITVVSIAALVNLVRSIIARQSAGAQEARTARPGGPEIL